MAQGKLPALLQLTQHTSGLPLTTDNEPGQHYVKYTTAFTVRLSSVKLPAAAIFANRSEEDLPMSRVKFNVNTEYAYLQNFKILQSQYSLLRSEVN